MLFNAEIDIANQHLLSQMQLDMVGMVDNLVIEPIIKQILFINNPLSKQSTTSICLAYLL